MDEQRILIIKDLLLKCVQIEQSVKPLVVKCLEGMVAKVRSSFRGDLHWGLSLVGCHSRLVLHDCNDT